MSSALPPKPVNERIRPEITRLPELTWWRKLVRCIFASIARFLIWLFIDIKLDGLENIPSLQFQGPLLVVSNHLGDADAVITLACLPLPIDAIAKAELRDFPILGIIMELYGVIWVHRGQPDRRAIHAVLEGLASGRIIGIAPEGRESLIGALENGTHGAAYLALKSDAPVLPIAFTGTENWRVYGNMKRFRRTSVTFRVGQLFELTKSGNRRQDLEQGTLTIMHSLADLLPEEYRGVYQDQVFTFPGENL